MRARPIPWFTVPLCMVAVSHDMSESTAIDKVNGRVCNKDLAREEFHVKDAPDRWFGNVLRDVPGKDTPPDRYAAPERVREARKLSGEPERLVRAGRFGAALRNDWPRRARGATTFLHMPPGQCRSGP